MKKLNDKMVYLEAIENLDPSIECHFDGDNLIVTNDKKLPKDSEIQAEVEKIVIKYLKTKKAEEIKKDYKEGVRQTVKYKDLEFRTSDNFRTLLVSNIVTMTPKETLEIFDVTEKKSLKLVAKELKELLKTINKKLQDNYIQKVQRLKKLEEATSKTQIFAI